MSTATSTARVDLVMSLLRRAVDPSADIGESKNAADKMVTIARRELVDFHVLSAAFAPLVHRPVKPAPEPEIHEPFEVHVMMPFGKHAGLTLGDIAQCDPSYLI